MQTTSVPTVSGQYWQWRDQAIYYVKAGDRHPHRPPLILVHGFGASTDHWKKNIAGLQNEFEVWAIDLLGFGRSAKPDWQYSGTLWRDQLRDFVTEIVQQPAVFAGNSLGGYASLCTAAQCPDVAAGVILLNSAGPFSDAQPQPKPSGTRQMIAKTMRSLLLQPLPSWVLFQYTRRRSVIRKTLNKVYLDSNAVTDELVEDIYRPSCDRGAAKVFASIFKSPRGANVDELLQQLSCPLMTIWGEGDPWMLVQDRGAKFREFYPQVTEHYIQSGHCPHDESPEVVNELIKDWVLSLS